MTPQERAEKIGSYFDCSDPDDIAFIAAQIFEAEGAQFENGYEMGTRHGFNSAREKAKGIAEGRKFYDPEGFLAYAIGKMEPE